MATGSSWASEAVDVGGSIGQLIGGIMGGKDVNRQLQTGINNAGQSLQKYYGNAATYQQPYSQAGQTGLAGQQNIANMAPMQSNFQYNYQQDPSYQNQLTSGNQNIMAQASSLGSLFSGPTMKALEQYGSNMANQSYNQNYQRALGTYENERNFNADQIANKYLQYAGLTGIGQAAANNLTGIQTQLGQGQANLDLMAGNANAGQQAQTWNTLSNFATNLTGIGNAQGTANQSSGSQNSGLNSGVLSGLFNNIMGSGSSSGGGIGSDSMSGNDFSGSDMSGADASAGA